MGSTASAFQGGGGESTKKGSSKKAVTKKNSGATSGDARAPNLTINVKQQLAAQMVKNAYNPEWFKKCIDEAGGIDKIVDIEAISLSTSDVQQYLLSGKVVENGESCAFGARANVFDI